MTYLQQSHQLLSDSQLWLGTSCMYSMPESDYRFEHTKAFCGGTS